MRQVRVLPVVGLAYAFLRGEAIPIIKAFWLPFLFATPFAYLAPADPLTASDRDLTFFAVYYHHAPLLVGGLLAALLGASSVAGATASRRILFGGELRASLQGRNAWYQLAGVSLSFAALFVGMSFAVPWALMSIALPLVSLIPLTEGQGFALGFLLSLSWLPVFAILFARVALIYPVTIASGKCNWGLAWSITHHNTWRILIILLLSIAPASIIASGIQIGMHRTFADSVLEAALHTIVQYAFWIASSALAFAALSYAYKVLNGVTAKHLFVPP